jgi:hypothetical protein
MGDRIAEAIRNKEQVQISKGRYSGLEPTT